MCGLNVAMSMEILRFYEISITSILFGFVTGSKVQKVMKGNSIFPHFVFTTEKIISTTNTLTNWIFIVLYLILGSFFSHTEQNQFLSRKFSLFEVFIARENRFQSHRTNIVSIIAFVIDSNLYIFVFLESFLTTSSWNDKVSLHFDTQSFHILFNRALHGSR